MLYDENFEPIKPKEQLITQLTNKRTAAYYTKQIESLETVMPFLEGSTLEIDGFPIELPLDKEPRLFLAQCHIWYERSKTYLENNEDPEETYALYSNDQLEYYYKVIYPVVRLTTFTDIQAQGRQYLLESRDTNGD